jgi:hypothetical protein
MRGFRDAKLMAKTLRQALAGRDIDLTHSETLEIVARQFGFDQWNILSAKLDKEEAASASVVIHPPIPVFRIFDVDKAKEFYCGFLGFALDWEHRFGDHFPLYCQVSRGGMRNLLRTAVNAVGGLGTPPAPSKNRQCAHKCD